MDKSLHVTGILIYRHQRNSTEILLVNDSFNHKRHWTAPKGRVIGDEDELKYVASVLGEVLSFQKKEKKIPQHFVGGLALFWTNHNATVMKGHLTD